MPGNGLTFAVFVGCQIDLVDLLSSVFELLYFSLFFWWDLVGRLKAVFNINAGFLFRQIADMSKRGHDFIVVPKKFSNCFGFCRRLNDQKFGHNRGHDNCGSSCRQTFLTLSVLQNHFFRTPVCA